MSQHTPGPWVKRGSRSLSGDYQIWSRSYPNVASVSNEYDEETEANARLIAAAPELLEALKVCSAELFAQCADHPRAMQYVEQARAAIAKAEIAKAEGETNE